MRQDEEEKLPFQLKSREENITKVWLINLISNKIYFNKNLWITFQVANMSSEKILIECKVLRFISVDHRSIQHLTLFEQKIILS